MATNAMTGTGNIYDVQKMKNPNNGQVLSLTNTMIERLDMLKDFPAFPSNSGLQHNFLRQTALPEGKLSRIGGYWGTSKVAMEQATAVMALIRSSYEAPVDTFTMEDPAAGQALLKANKDGHIEGLAQGWARLLLQGSSSAAGISGLEAIAPYSTYDDTYCFNVGGTGTDLRSIWLAAPGIETVHTIYNPNHPTLGAKMEDKGEVRKENPDDATEHRYDICIEFEFMQGICIRDQRALKRVCNIPILEVPTATLVNKIIDATIINAVSGKQWFAYCDDRTYAVLIKGLNDRSQIQMSDRNVYRTSLPMIGENIIIRRMDALKKTIGSGETVVSAG